MEYVCDNCGTVYHIQNIESFGPLKCHRCGYDLNFAKFQKKNSTKYHGLVLIFLMGVLVLSTFVLCSPALGLIYAIMGMFSLTIGRYVDKKYESVTTDKLRRVSIAILVLSLILFGVMIFLLRMNISGITETLILLQLVFLGLFVGSSFEELSKPSQIRKSDKLNLKIAELEEENVEGLKKTLPDLNHLEKSDNFAELVDSNHNFELEDRARNRAMQLADQIIEDDVLGNAFPSLKRHIIGFMDFLSIYIFLEKIYAVYKGDELVESDFDNIYFSGLDEMIMTALDKFDSSTELHPLTTDFFEKILNMEWDSASSETFCQKFEGLREYYMLNYHNDHYDFFIEENSLIKALTVCSAYSQNKCVAGKEDIVKAHETYIKLVNTDLTQFYAKKEFLKFKAPVTKTIVEDQTSEEKVPNEDENLKKVPRDVQLAFLITLLALAVQIVNFVFNELLMVHPEGMMKIVISFLIIPMIFSLSLISYWFLKYLGWDLFHIPPKTDDEYLVCLRCGGYYKLLPNESAEDFDDKCECGGKLIQSTSPELQEEPTLNIHYSFISFFLTLLLSCLILYFAFKTFNMDIFEIIKGHNKYYLNILLVLISGVLIIGLFRFFRFILGLLCVKLNLD